MSSEAMPPEVEPTVLDKAAPTKPVAAPLPDKIYGKTPEGRIFEVPETHDMVRNLLDPRLSKSLSEVIIVVTLSSYVLLFLWLPQSYRVPVFFVLFAFWRSAYNAGIGWLLSQQSNRNLLVSWAKELKLFDKSKETTTWQHFLRRDLAVKFKNDPRYEFYSIPVEYNTWLVFRNFVDLVLMSDFTCYILLAFSCASFPNNHTWPVVLGRWLAGIVLFAFNLWVKLDAHRVVKDYAWYWGDFFFLEDVHLTFDGVFEMAPHPMYSIGYAGFYGISLMAASYTLFFVSVLAHAAQFAFLIIVENPHIEKTYSPPPPPSKPRKSSRRRSSRRQRGSQLADPELDPSLRSIRELGTTTADDSDHSDSVSVDAAVSVPVVVDEDDSHQEIKPRSKALLVFNEFSITRSSDILLVLLVLHSFALYFVPRSGLWYVVTFMSALLWRLLHNVGLGYLLRQQSESKAWTRIFLKFGLTPLDAYEQWQVIYNTSTVMSYVTFGVFCLRQWESPIGVPFWPFRYIVGGMLIALQMWTSYSIYESIGEYGWFFGDFFYTKPEQQLTYSGIYRYLNNPERLFGIAGVWGMALLSNSSSVTFLAFIWTYGGMAFIQFVEQPHMQKLYGGQIRREAGVTKTIRQATKLAPPQLGSRVNHIQGSIDKVISDTKIAVESFLSQAKPKITGVKDAVSDTKVMLRQYPARMTIIRIADDIHVDTSLYSLKVHTEPLVRGTDESLHYEFGTPLEVEWTADANHSKKDWIGLYRIADSADREVTRISSSGRWSAVNKEGYHGHTDSIINETDTSGKVKFSGSRLFWESGTYEFRYHHDGKHNVMTISQPFQIVSTAQELSEDLDDTADHILELVATCYQGTNLEPPSDVDDVIELQENSPILNRLVYGIKEKYGVDLAPSVVIADQDALGIAVRLHKVKSALRPFVESVSKPSSPVLH